MNAAKPPNLVELKGQVRRVLSTRGDWMTRQEIWLGGMAVHPCKLRQAVEQLVADGELEEQHRDGRPVYRLPPPPERPEAAPTEGQR